MRKTIKQKRQQKQDVINYSLGVLLLCASFGVAYLGVSIYGL